jgi:hypothetical protein
MENLTLYEQAKKDEADKELKYSKMVESFKINLSYIPEKYFETYHDNETVTNTKTVKGYNGTRVISEETFLYTKTKDELNHIILDERARSGLEDYINNWILEITEKTFPLYRGLTCQCFINLELGKIDVKFKVPKSIEKTSLDIFYPFSI